MTFELYLDLTWQVLADYHYHYHYHYGPHLAGASSDINATVIIITIIEVAIFINAVIIIIIIIIIIIAILINVVTIVNALLSSTFMKASWCGNENCLARIVITCVWTPKPLGQKKKWRRNENCLATWYLCVSARGHQNHLARKGNEEMWIVFQESRIIINDTHPAWGPSGIQNRFYWYWNDREWHLCLYVYQLWKFISKW